jgi:ketosteroid isomerase-like protein
MNTQLPQPIHDYVNASNAHDVKSILACFSDTATVQDEGQTLKGKQSIEGWIMKSIGKYKFQLKPLGVKTDGNQVVVSMQVSGTFDGSPVELEFRFKTEKENIVSLVVR